MQFILDSRFARIGAALVAGGLIYLSNRPDALWWAAFLAPIPLLMAVFQAPRAEALLLCLGAALLGNAPQLMQIMIFTGAVGAALILALQALQWLLTVQRTRTLARHSRHWLIVFAYPAFCAGLDTLVAAVSPHGSAGSLAYSQMKAVPVIQIAALAGTPGIVFIVSLFGSLVAIAWRCRLNIERPVLAYGLPILVLAVSLSGGVARLGEAEPGATIPVGLVAIDAVSPDSLRQAQPDSPAWSAYGAAVAGLAAQGAKLVVLPEEIAALDAEDLAGLRDRLGAIARDNRVHLLVGLRVLAGDHMENRAWLFSPEGELVVDYAKRHLVPGLEAGISPGRDDAVVDIGADKFGIAICKDMDFPLLGRGYAAHGVAAMLVPAWDARFDDWAHAAPAMLRGVEGGYTVIRAARDGLISVSDRYGRVLAAKATSGAGVTSLEFAAPLGGAATPYGRYGGWFGWLCVAASVATLVPLRHRKRR